MSNLKRTILFAVLVVTALGILPETATAQTIGGSGIGRYLIPSFSRSPETQPAAKNPRPQQKSHGHSRRKPTLSRRAK